MENTTSFEPTLICATGADDRELAEYGVSESPAQNQLWDLTLCAGVVVSLALLVYAAVSGTLFRPLILEAENYRWARLLIRPSMLWAAMGALLLGFRTILWFRYRSWPAETLTDAPSLSVIIPAYNEGEMVLRSIESVANARYPRGRLQLIVIDEGSRDNTWEYIREAVHRY